MAIQVLFNIEVPTPTSSTYATTKTYVDDNSFSAGSLLRYKRVSQFTAANYTYTVNGTGSPTSSTSNPVPSGYVGWFWNVGASSSSRITYKMILPDVSSLYSETSSDSYSVTYEVIVRVKKSTAHPEITALVDFKFYNGVDSEGVPFGEIDWMGDAPVDLERGYVYFFVLRSFAYGDGSTYAHRWVGNVQGKVPITSWT